MAGGKIDILVSPDVKDFPDKLESGLKGSLAAAGKIGATIGGVLGSAATIKGVAELGVGFDKQMNTMAAVSQATGQQLAAVEQKARELGRSTDLTATSASDAAAAMTELVKGGFSVSEAMDAAKGTLQLAAAAQIDAASAATIQSQALQSFGLDASKASMAADVLAGAANASSAEIGGVAQGLQQSGAVAHQFGLTLEDNATALAIFANAGIQGSDAGTLLKTALQSLTDQGKPAQSAIEELGLTVYDAQGKFVGLESLFGQLAQASKSMSEEQFQAATNVLFGSDAMRIAAIAAQEGADGWREAYGQVTRAGQAAEVAAAQAQGIPGILEAIQNQAEDTGLAVYKAFSDLAVKGGGVLIETLQDVGPKVESFAQGVASGIESAMPTIERVAGVISDGFGQIIESAGVLGGAGESAIKSFAGAFQPAASGALSLSESLSGLSGPLIAATAALAVGKWQSWGDTVGSSSKKFSGFFQDAYANQDYFRRMGEDVNLLTASWVTLEDKVPVFSRMGDAFRNAAEPMRELASQHRDLASAAAESAIASGNLFDIVDRTGAEAMHRGAARAADFAGTLKGSLAAGVEAAKSAGAGLIDALGGGWNVAIAGVVAGVTVITSELGRIEKSKQLLRELQDQAADTGDALYQALANKDLGAQLEALNDGMAGFVDKQRQLAEQAPKWYNSAANAITGAWADINLFDNGRSSVDVSNEFRGLEEASQKARLFSDAIQDAGINAEEAATAVGGSTAQYDELISRLDLSTDSGRTASDMLREQRQEFLRLKDITDSLAPGSMELSKAMAVIGDEAASSEDKVRALGTALDNMLGIDPTADEALFNLHEEIRQVTEQAQQAVDQTKGFGDSLFGEDGALNPSSENAANLYKTLTDMRQNLLDVAVAGEDVGAAFDAQRPALDALAQQYGLTTDQMQVLLDHYGLVPSKIETVVDVSVDGALNGLEEVFGAIEKNQVKAGEPLPLSVANIDDTKTQLEDLGWKVEELHRNADGSGAIKVTADTQDAIDKVDNLVKAMSQIKDEKGITFTSNSTDEVENIKKLGIEVESLGDCKYKINSNSADEIKKLVEIGVLVEDEKTGKMVINSNLDDVLAKGKEWDKRNGKQTSETHTITTIEKRIQEWSSYYSSGRASDSSGTSVGQKYADGAIRRRAFDGWLSKQQAQIVPGGSWVTFGEDETDGEAFIPFATSKRKRSTQILAETASVFGYGLVDSDGNIVQRDGTNVGPLSTSYMADGGVIASITGIVRDRFPEMTITSTQRSTSDNHGRGLAVDFSNGTDDTPEMQRAAQWFFDNYGSELLELIHSPFSHNVKDGSDVGDGMGFYGADVMGQHRNHVHVAASAPLGAPSGSASGSSESTTVSGSVSGSYSISDAGSRDVSWGEASDLWKLASKNLPERRKVSLVSGMTDSASANDVMTEDSGGDPNGWGHDYFVHEIARSAKAHGLPVEGGMIGVGTALVESGNPLLMYANASDPESLKFRHDAVGSDHDSSGLFQQRNNGAWGTISDRMNPFRSASMFYDAMLQKFPNWQQMDPGAVAQGVQVSAFPDRYAQKMAAALSMVKSSGVYDQGGWLADRGFALNLSGRPEPILNGDQWDIARGNMSATAGLIDSINRLVPPLEKLADTRQAQNQTASYGRTFAGGWFDQAQVVKDAEKGLAETRLQVADDIATVRKAEQALAESREELAKLEAEGGALTTAQKRQQEDAEEALRKAREDGDAEKIANAEKKLSRVREDNAEALSKSTDKNAKAVLAAQEKVNKATDALADAQFNAAHAAETLEAAERTVGAARFQAAADLAGKLGDAIDTAFKGISSFFGVLAKHTALMEETRQKLAAERIAQQTADLKLQRSRLDAAVAEQDILRTRAMGVVAVADAEAALQAAREAAALKGATSIDAMSAALDRARVTGRFAIEDVAQSVIDRTSEVRAAQWAVEQARAQAAKDELDATHKHRLAVLDLAQATLTQQKAVALVDISTRQLQQQAAALGGLTAYGAQRASSGWSGLATAGGGLGKLLGGLAAGAAGFAAGGPVGALLAGGAGVVSGLSDLLIGGRQAWTNRDEIKQSWDGMSTLDKVITGGGLLLGGGVAGAGAYASQQFGGPEMAGVAAELGAQIAAQSANYAGAAIDSDLSRVNSLADEERALLQLKIDQEQARIDAERAKSEMQYLVESTVLQANVEITDLLGRIAKADTTKQADALAEAAIVAAERRDQMLDILTRQLDVAESQAAAGRSPSQVINISIPPGEQPVSREAFDSLVDTLNKVQQEVEIRTTEISGSEYLASQTT